MSAAIDLTGKSFGSLQVIRRVGIASDGSVLWECLCKCGDTRQATTVVLRSGRAVSCGCQPPRKDGEGAHHLPYNHRLNQRMPWPKDYFEGEPVHGFAPTAWWELPERSIARRVTKRKVTVR